MKSKWKRTMSMLLCLSMVALSACSVSVTGPDGNGVKISPELTEEREEASGGKSTASSDKPDKKKPAKTKDGEAKEKNKDKTAEDETPAEPTAEDAASVDIASLAKPLLLKKEAVERKDYTWEKAEVPSYKVDNSLSGIVNIDSFYFEDDFRRHLAEDGFFVEDGAGSEFFEIYEWNRYSLTPNFVTVDSLMHTYHLYFSYLLKTIERDKLYDRLKSLTDRMLTASVDQMYEMAYSSQYNDTVLSWYEASARNVAFFAVAKSLLEPSWKPSADDLAGDEDVLTVVKDELSLIDEAQRIAFSPLSGDLLQMEDYSQYKPRGYYDTNETLKRYFRAMMWYGRRNFTQKEETLDRSALLMTLGMDTDAYSEWETIYAVTSFFAGASDDNGVSEYLPLVREAYGRRASDLDILTLLSDVDGWDRFHELTGQLDPPAINSVPMWDDQGETDKAKENLGFRFMGQRFSIDETVMQQLVYSAVKENPQGMQRMLPDALDFPAALGSDTAREIVEKEYGAGSYQNYSENMDRMRKAIQDAPSSLWSASLYAGWIDTLRPLLDEKGEGYPQFMQSKNWRKKNLESFLGSYTELKHDTVLYSKQLMAEMGGGDEDEPDDRGYVEPEPTVFARFSSLAKGTASGLDEFGLLTYSAKRDLGRLATLAESLRTISEKELMNQVLTNDEYELIRIYGGEIEHFWQEAYREDAEGREFFDSEEFPAALVVDIATDPNGSVLQLANGNPSMIYCVVPVDGTLRIARGSVYDFYEFTQPIDDRLTDHEWRVRLGVDPDDNGEIQWGKENVPDKPSWTMDYRVVYHWD